MEYYEYYIEVIRLKELKKALEKHEKIVCLLNVYEQNIGNCTKVIFNNCNEILLNRSIRSTVHHIAKHYIVDINELKKRQQKLLNKKYYTPLPINENLLFISIKTRQPRVAKDPCMSYINLYEIDRLDKKLPILHMKNGLKIESLESINTLKERYKDGQLCAKFQSHEYKHSPLVAEDPISYLYPATKGDVHAIAKDIEELREMVRHIIISRK